MEETTLDVSLDAGAAGQPMPAPTGSAPAAPADAAPAAADTPAADAPAGQNIPAADDSDPAALLAELRQYRAAAQDRALLADPEKGAVYGQLRGRVQQLLTYCHDSGLHDVTAESAFAVALLEHWPTLQADARRTALQTVTANAAASPGPLGASAAPAAPDFDTMSSDEFARYHYRALHGGF